VARSPRDVAAHNANYVGGDILTGANTAWQTVMRPRPARDPYATGIPGVAICSASTPPGAGVHGMCGFHAARSVLRAARSSAHVSAVRR
jgi:phytoene dehydrogenase-like protein